MPTMKEVAEKMFEEMKQAKDQGVEGFIKNFHHDNLQSTLILMLSAMKQANRLEKIAAETRPTDAPRAAFLQITSDAIYLGLNEMSVALMEGIRTGKIPEPPKWNDEAPADSVPST